MTTIENLFKKIDKIPFMSPDAGALYSEIMELYEEAKKMEKQQIIEAHGDKLKKSSGVTNYEYWFSGEDYYNEKFK
jgi:hypothetical protein